MLLQGIGNRGSRLHSPLRDMTIIPMEGRKAHSVIFRDGKGVCDFLETIHVTTFCGSRRDGRRPFACISTHAPPFL
jgi:hypothetical protein